MSKTNLYLIGPMGSGKTAVGRRLATLLGKRFFDSDAEIERRTGVDIRFIFDARLRRKLPPDTIETVRGMGYRLAAVPG